MCADPSSDETRVTVMGPSVSGLRLVARAALANGALPATALITAPLLARALSPAGRGEMTAIYTPSVLAGAVCLVGLQWVTSVLAGRRHLDLRQTQRIFVLGLAASVVACVGLWILAPVLLPGAPHAQFLLRMTALLIPPFQLLHIYRGAVLGLRLYHGVNRERWTSALSRLALVVGLFVTGTLSVTSAVLVLVATPVIGGLVLVVLTWSTVVGEIRGSEGEPGKGRWRTLLSSSSRSWAGDVVNVMNGRLDQAMMAPLTTATQLGLYSVAVTLAELPIQLAEAVRAIAFAESNSRDSAAIIARATRLLLALLVVLAVLLGVISHLAVPLVFGQEFSEARGMVWVLLVGTVPLAGSSVVGSGLMTLNRQGQQAVAQLTGLVLAVGGILVLVPLMGGMGAAVVSVAVYTLVFGLLVFRFSRASGIPARACLILQGGDVRWIRQQRSRRIQDAVNR